MTIYLIGSLISLVFFVMSEINHGEPFRVVSILWGIVATILSWFGVICIIIGYLIPIDE